MIIHFIDILKLTSEQIPSFGKLDPLLYNVGLALDCAFCWGVISID